MTDTLLTYEPSMIKPNVFQHAFQVTMRQWRVAAIVYFFQGCLALTLGMQIYSVLQSSIGDSLEINKLVAQFDHTVFTDFLKIHGASITPLVGQLRWLLLVWLVFSVFMNAGLMYGVALSGTREQKSVRTFWEGGFRYFFSFLKLSLIFLLLALALTVLLWFPMALFLEPSLQYFSTEKYTVWLVVGLLAVYITGLGLLFVWSVLSRLVKIQTGNQAIRSLRIGLQIFGENKLRLMGLLLAFLAIQLFLILVYWSLEAGIGMTTPAGIVVLFVVQQVFVFFRIQLRQLMYASLSFLIAPNPA